MGMLKKPCINMKQRRNNKKKEVVVTFMVTGQNNPNYINKYGENILMIACKKK